MTFVPLHWGHQYLTGVKEIDLQHHYFMELINRIGRELESTEDHSHRERLMNELGKYATFHFVSEENLMLKMGYPKFNQHVLLHRELLDKLSSHRIQDSPEAFIGFLTAWFLNHTIEQDQKIGDFQKHTASAVSAP
jgi:hemerythrin